MRITCPHCGTRDIQEFTCLGAAGLKRPAGMTATAAEMHAYVHERDNPAGPHQELWYHASGCHTWLVIARDTRSHAIAGVTAAASPDSGFSA